LLVIVICCQHFQHIFLPLQHQQAADKLHNKTSCTTSCFLRHAGGAGGSKGSKSSAACEGACDRAGGTHVKGAVWAFMADARCSVSRVSRGTVAFIPSAS
jgi:hypothetical protein